MRSFLFAMCALTLVACGLDEYHQEENQDSEKKVLVSIEQPAVRSINYVLHALGTVETASQPTLSSEITGKIIQTNVDEGDTVTTGQVLLLINGDSYKISREREKAELRRHKALLKSQRQKVARISRLSATQSVSKDRLEDEETQLKVLTAQRDVSLSRWQQSVLMESKTSITAPHNGIIARRMVSQGDYVTPGRALFSLVSVEHLRARLAFPEHEADRIATGQTVHLTTPSKPDSFAEGVVKRINPRINDIDRAIEVLVEFDNPGSWYPGASVDAELIVKPNISAITVPSISVVQRPSGSVVYVVVDDKAIERTVILGWRESGWVEVLDGIYSDDKIVVEGASRITNDTVVKVKQVAP